MIVDLETLSPKQARVAQRFIEALLTGKSVSYMDFAPMPQEEFEAIADAIAELLRPATRH